MRVLRRHRHRTGLHHAGQAALTGDRTARAAKQEAGRSAGEDAGMATLEMAILAGVVLLIVFTIVQGGFWYHARTVAMGAAEEAVRAERYEGSPGGGAAVASSFIARLGGDDVLPAAAVSVARSDERVSVTVTGESPALVPGLSLSVSQTAAAPVERFASPRP